MFPKTFKKIKSNRQSTWQKEVFLEIWDERPHICFICGKYIPEPLTYVFAHWLSKWVHPEYKFDKRVIFLVCSIDCHNDLDTLFAHQSPWYILSLNDPQYLHSTHTDNLEK